MKAGKAYISSLGTTGLLIASSLLLLVVVGTLIAFDAWPSGDSAAQPDTIAIAKVERAETKKTDTPAAKPAATERAAERRADRVERRAAAKRRKRAASKSGKSDGSGGPSGGRPVRGGSDGRPPANTGGGNAPSDQAPSGGNGVDAPIDVNSVPTNGSETIRQISTGVSTISPEAGQIVQQTGDAVVGTVNEVVENVLPNLGDRNANGNGSGGLIP